MNRLRYALWAALAISAWPAQPARALEVQVTVDSCTVANGTAGFLDFQFSAGDPAAQTAQVVVKNFAATALTPGVIKLTNSATGGPLPTNVTIQNDPTLLTNRARQAVTYGTSSAISFTLDFTGNALTTPGTADSTFYFSLLDSSNQSTFPGYSLPHMTITFPASGTGVLSFSMIPQIVPEPGTIVLAAMAATVLLAMRRRNRG